MNELQAEGSQRSTADDSGKAGTVVWRFKGHDLEDREQQTDRHQDRHFAEAVEGTWREV